MKRFGKVIDTNSYMPGSFLRLVTLITIIVIIPLQLFCDGFVQSKEQTLIIHMQTGWIPCSDWSTEFCHVAIAIPHWVFRTKFVVFSCFALLLLADSWLAYKTTLVTCMGIVFISFLQMCFKSGRPFWDVQDITSNGHCVFDFGGPSESAFNMTFFWTYVIIMFLFKYYKNPNKIVNWIIIVVLLGFWVANYIFSVYNGMNYLYQLVLGQMIGFCYLIASLVFDNEIHRYSLRTGFSMRSSRARKFYLFFFSLGLFIFFLVIFSSMRSTWTMPQDWIVNANYEDNPCQQEFMTEANNSIGLNQTFEKSSVIFVVIGMIFAWPFAMLHFSALQWINTARWKRVVRMILGLSIAVGAFFFFAWIVSDTNDLATIFFFGHALPNFLISFFIFGLFPIMCKWMHLIQKEDQFVEQFPDLAVPN